jgi:ABC-type multidrug transport system ATPase subunit
MASPAMLSTLVNESSVDSEKESPLTSPVPAAPTCLSWSDIIYDIPLSKKKVTEAKNAENGDAERGYKPSPQDKEASEAADASSSSSEAKANTRRILSGISGSVNKGEVVAVLGASGAGKTTLLNILSARLSSVGTLEGKVLFHGKPRDAQTWKRTVGFVEQDDVMLGLLTVQETVEYSAKMRLPSKLYTQEQKAQRVQDTIDMLRLQKCRDTRIGTSTTRGISGGERKRTSIAVVSDGSIE